MKAILLIDARTSPTNKLWCFFFFWRVVDVGNFERQFSVTLTFLHRYDAILRDGLPDWRQPVYYYRRVRKMGIIELLLVIFLILTIGHYIVAWSIYLEKKFELVSLPTEPMLSERLKSDIA